MRKLLFSFMLLAMISPAFAQTVGDTDTRADGAPLIYNGQRWVEDYNVIDVVPPLGVIRDAATATNDAEVGELTIRQALDTLGDVLTPGNGGAITERRRNYYFLDESIGTVPAATQGNWYEVGVFADNVADFDPLAPPPVVITQYVAIEDPANPGAYTWSEQGQASQGGDTKHIFNANERLQVLYFTLNDRRAALKEVRRKRFALTVDELENGNADWTADHANAQRGYTHRLTSAVNLAGANYNYRIHWKRVGGEYEFEVFENHAGRWNTFGAISGIVFKYAANDPAKPTWQATTAYSAGDQVIGKAPVGVTETAGNYYLMTAVQDRPGTIAALDATEWTTANWTFEPFTAVKQDVVVALYADRPDPATMLVGSTVSVVNNTPDSSLNGAYTVLGPVGGAGTGYSVAGSGQPIRAFATLAEATAATIEPGELVVVGFGPNKAGTWYHHETTPRLFDPNSVDFTVIDRSGFDAASDWLSSFSYVGDQRKVFRIMTPATMAAGQFLSQNGVVLNPGTEYLGSYPADRDAADSVAAIADDLATINEFALIQIFEPAVSFAIDDISEWVSGETGLLRGQLRKYVNGFTTEIYSRVSDGNDAGGVSPGSDWQNITAQLTEHITLISAAGAGGGFNAIMGSPTPTRYEVIGDGLPLNIGYPPDTSDDKGRSEVYNNSNVVVTIAGKAIQPGGGAIVSAHGQSTPHVTPFGGTIQTGAAVERLVVQRNRNQTISFGDLQFMARVPTSSPNQYGSMQMRMGSGSMTIRNFTTWWSHQQGGASEEAISFTQTTSWRYWRVQGLTLSQHNNFQEASFEANGWLYHVGVIVGGSWNNNRFFFTRWRLAGIKGDAGADGTDGIDGVDAASIDHISLTAGDSSPGTTDTYTLWSDAGETVSLGTFNVPIPAVPAGIETVELGSYSGNYVTGDTFTLPGGRTWQDVLDEFQFVYVLVGGNSLYSSDQTAQYHVSDLTTQGRDMAVTGYMTHGSNAYHFRLVTPPMSSTTVAINNDGSSMQAQRIKLIGVK